MANRGLERGGAPIVPFRTIMAAGLARASLDAQTEPPAGALVETDIPARLDRLRWGRFHTLVVIALGITWILDGLEVTLAGAVVGRAEGEPACCISRNAEIGFASSAYLAGAVLGALCFGWLTDRLGRKQLVLHHPRGLSGRHRRDRAVLERRRASRYFAS